MAKRITVLICLLLTFTVCACRSQPSVYMAQIYGTDYTFDTDSGTITDGVNTYNYFFTGTEDDFSFEIQYPDGSSFWFKQSGASGYGGWSEDYDPDKYADGQRLLDVILLNAPKPADFGQLLPFIILLIAGICNTAAPYYMWQLGYGWRFKDAQPSDIALWVTRAGGILAIAVSVIAMLSVI